MFVADTISFFLLSSQLSSSNCKQCVSKYKSPSAGSIPPSLKYKSLEMASISTEQRINNSEIFTEYIESWSSSKCTWFDKSITSFSRFLYTDQYRFIIVSV